MKVGDLVYKKISEQFGVIVAISQRDSQLMRVFWTTHEAWCGEWHLEVVNESR
jgi:hypothetical protein